MRKFIIISLALLLTVSQISAQAIKQSGKAENRNSKEFANSSFIRLQAEDAPLVNAASAAVRVAPKVARRWRDYWSPKQSIIIYKPGNSAILISDVSPPLPFQPVNPASLPRELRGRTYFHRGALPGLAGNFNTEYPIGEIFAIAVKLESSIDETIDVLFHEGFHKFQEKNFARTTGADSIKLHEEKRLDNKILSQPEFVAQMELERRILSRAVERVSSRDLKPLLRQYLSVRRQRIQNLPEDIRTAELNIERKEGTASIIGSEAASLVTGQKKIIPSRQVKTFISDSPWKPQDNSTYARFRSRSYGSGAIIAWILTRMNVDWRQRSQQGASFETLLSEAINFKPQDASTLAQASLDQFNFKELLTEAEKWKSTLPPEITVADFYLKGKVRLVINIPTVKGKGIRFTGRGAGLPSEPEEGITIFLTSQSFSFDYRQISLLAENRPYMLNSTRAKHYKHFEVTVMLDELPQITGFESGKPQIQWLDGGTIEGGGVKLKVERAATLDITQDSITVHIKELF